MAGPDPRTVVELRPHHRRPDPLWRDVVGRALRRERRRQGRTLREVAEAARISLPYLSEVERGRKEASSEILAAAAGALQLSLVDVLRLVHREVVPEAEAAREATELRGAVATPPDQVAPPAGGATASVSVGAVA
jgi:transcriptional regulator with XRE-family HTH domain